MPAFLNSFSASSPLSKLDYHLGTPAHSYDVNFCAPVPEELATHGGVTLVPIIVGFTSLYLYQRLDRKSVV